MDTVVRLAAHRPAERGVPALCARLHRLEEATSPDEATMDVLAGAERRVLGALAGTRAGTPAEVAGKLAVLARRAEAADGLPCDAGLALLRSALGDLRRLDPAAAVA
jgi:hypothetical protein